MMRLLSIMLFANTRAKQRGFSLVELMIGITLGLVLTSGVFMMYVSNKRVYTEQDQMGRLQETARFAMNQIVGDLRMAGHAGCPNDLNVVSNHINGGGTTTSIYRFIPLEGSENATNWKPDDSTHQVANMVAGTDGITVRYLRPANITVLAPYMTTATDNIFVNTVNGLRQGETIAIADCKSVDMMVITNDDPSGDGEIAHGSGTDPAYAPGNVTNALSKPYGADAKIMRFVSRRYFIQNSDNGTGPALWMASSGGAGEELFEGVENMQILYGEDNVGNDGVADTYVNATAVGNWNNVVSVRIGLLMRTVNEYGDVMDSSTYDVNGTNVNPTDDRRRRRVFSATVQIRNRVAL